MSNLVIIGPKSSGKTTYIGGLAIYSMLKSSQNYKITPNNDDAKAIAENAQNLIQAGDHFDVTPFTDIFTLPTYSFAIEFIPKFGFGQKERINLVIKDFAGEVFDNINLGGQEQAKYSEFWEDALRKDVKGCLIMLSEWDKVNYDLTYRASLQTLFKLIEQYERNEDYRLAVAMSKCERGELWPGRIEPEIDIFDAHLPNTKKVLQDHIQPQNLQFYALSTFGVSKRNDPRPNCKDILGQEGSSAVLRWPERWKPYNMIAPLYWLTTGRRLL